VIIAVTGAGGFIGSALVPALSGAGHSVIPLVRIGKGKSSALGNVKEIDVATGEGLARGFEGADSVVHLAARTPAARDSGKGAIAYRMVNVEGTRNVVRTAVRSGVKAFLHVSSIKAMGESSDRILYEDDDCKPETPYGVSKLESEKIVREETEGKGTRGIILRLPMVYGPGDQGNFYRMIRWADRGFPLPIFSPESLRSMIYIGNVVAGIMAVLKNSPAAGPSTSVYILKDRLDCSSRMIYTMICGALGKSPRFLNIPGMLARFGEVFSGDIRRVAKPFRVGSEKITREMEFAPPFDLETAICETVRWYRCSRG